MIRSLIKRVSLLAFAVALLVPATLAQAQQPSQQPAPEVDLSDEEVQKVAELMIEIGDVRAEYQNRLREAGGSDDARAIQEEMQNEINQTIEDFEGLTADRYDTIIRAAQADGELKDRILTQVQKEQEKREDPEG